MKKRQNSLKIIIVAMIVLILPANLFCLMPPDKMAARNLEADLILVGRVMGAGKILLPEKNVKFSPPKGLFSMEVLHVIKGCGKVSTGDHIEILYEAEPADKKKIESHSSGIVRISVKSGDLVVVYLNLSDHQGFYKPIAGGSSVAVIPQRPCEAANNAEKVLK